MPPKKLSPENYENRKETISFPQAIQTQIGWVKTKVAALIWTGALAITLWTVALKSGDNWQEARIFSTDYNSVVSGFIKKYPTWKKADWVHYSTSKFWKTNNMPFEAPPIIEHRGEQIIDIWWPQNETQWDIISMVDILNQNNISPDISESLLSIMIAENYLTTPNLEKLRKFLPSWIENTIGSYLWKDMSNSAMRIKSNFLNDFEPTLKKELLQEIAHFKMPIASRDRAIRIWWKDAKDGIFPLYEIAWYTKAEDFIRDFENGKIETKSEVWFASGVVYVKYLHSIISQRERFIWMKKSEWEIPQFPQSLYKKDVYSLIHTYWKYGDGDYKEIFNEIEKIESEIKDIDIEIQKVTENIKNWSKVLWNKTKKDLKKQRALNISKNNSILKELKAKKIVKNKEIEWLKKELTQYSKEHYTLFKSTLTSLFHVFWKLNVAGAFYATNAHRALWLSEKNGKIGTFDQFMWNLSIATHGGNDLLLVDGDPWTKTKWVIEKLERYPVIYEKWMWRMITLRPLLEWYIKGTQKDFDTDFFYKSIHSSVETKFITLSLLSSFAKNDTDIKEKINLAWKKYTIHMNPKPMEELFEIVSDPKKLWKLFHMKDPESISAFYYNYFAPYLMATVVKNYEVRIVVPEIQKKWSQLVNNSDTILRLANYPFDTLSLQWNSEGWDVSQPWVVELPEVKILKKGSSSVEKISENSPKK